MPKELKSSQLPVPPYLSFATFLNALQTVVEHGVPDTIDSDVLRKFNSLNQRMVVSAFKFMGFIDDDSKPTQRLKDYVAADPEKHKEILGFIIKEKYPKQVNVLPNGTLQQLRDSFNDINVEPSVKAKIQSFFIKAARETGYAISRYIETGLKAKGPRKGSAKRKPREKPDNGDGNGNGTNLPPKTEIEKGMVRVPIAVGVGRTWTVIVSEEYTKQDVERFLQIAQIILGDGTTKKGGAS